VLLSSQFDQQSLTGLAYVLHLAVTQSRAHGMDSKVRVPALNSSKLAGAHKSG
jgi:hypothetical protein